MNKAIERRDFNGKWHHMDFSLLIPGDIFRYKRRADKEMAFIVVGEKRTGYPLAIEEFRIYTTEPSDV